MKPKHKQALQLSEITLHLKLASELDRWVFKRT